MYIILPSVAVFDGLLVLLRYIGVFCRFTENNLYQSCIRFKWYLAGVKQASHFLITGYCGYVCSEMNLKWVLKNSFIIYIFLHFCADRCSAQLVHIQDVGRVYNRSSGSYSIIKSVCNLCNYTGVVSGCFPFYFLLPQRIIVQSFYIKSSDCNVDTRNWFPCENTLDNADLSIQEVYNRAITYRK